MANDFFAINVQTEGVQRLFGQAAKQAPFALANTLNDLAFFIRGEQPKQMERDLDRPKPWTKRGVFVKKTNKHELRAEIFIDPRRAEYLIYQVEGGLRRPHRIAIKEPSKTFNTDLYGNIPRNELKDMLEDPDHFSGVPKGKTNIKPAGIWERIAFSRDTGRATKIKLKVLWIKKAQYRKRYRFFESGKKIVKKRSIQTFRRRYRQALRTAR